MTGASWKHGAIGFRCGTDLKAAVDAFIEQQRVPPRPSEVAKMALREFILREAKKHIAERAREKK